MERGRMEWGWLDYYNSADSGIVSVEDGSYGFGVGLQIC